MKKNKEQIEKAATRKLESVLEQTSSIQTSFNSEDKTPLLDGYIRLYDVEEGEQTKKESFLGHINVQIKGTTNNRIFKSGKFSVNTTDIEGFKKINGCIYFVVYVSGKEEIIYFKHFLPFELQNIDTSGKSITQKFHQFPESVADIKTDLNYFLENQNAQSDSVLGIHIPLEKIKTLSAKIPNRTSYGYEIFNRGATLYYKSSEGIDIPIAMVVPDSHRQVANYNEPIKVGPHMDLMANIIIDVEKNYSLFNIDDFIKYEYKHNMVNFSYDLKKFKTFDKLFHKVKVLSALIDNGFNVRDHDFDILEQFSKTESSKLTEVRNFNNFLESVYMIFSKLSISLDFDYFSLEENTKNGIENMVNWEDTIDEQASIRTFTLNDNLYYLLLTPEGIENIFLLDNKYSFFYGESPSMKIYPSLIPRENLEKVYHFDKDIVLNNIKDLYNDNIEHSDFINGYLLDIIKTYDRSKSDDFLKLAYDIGKMQVDMSADTINLINFYQVIIRQRELTFLEMQQLRDTRNKTKEKFEDICLGILLRDSDIIDRIGELSPEEKEDLSEWPIYELVN
ncbi:DUF4365 domain-containing protein [Marinilactibacillus sp. XAAS-LB27]|uniref:DUF4365 domain-containing protein n=1 Tax=Marinilactibacillus sp. XAAS-LB27 TaxID=3114538 RepID=UPI002E18FE64|nr:DUF4365 domain-containing protein [Marinilactibacillus sp. XAAS-LB27]